MPTYKLFKTKSMLLSATSRNCQSDADLHAVQNPECVLVKNKEEEPARCWLTICSKPKACFSVSNKQGRPASCWLTSCLKHRACSCQQQVGRVNQTLTYILFKTHNKLLLAISRKGQPDADSPTFRNPEHALVNYKQKRPVRCWLTYCSIPRACSCQQ